MTNARVQAPVEPLSRPAWDRVEADLFERLAAGEHLRPAAVPVAPAERRRLWLGAGAFAAAAALALVWQLAAPTGPLAGGDAAPAATVAPVGPAAPAGRTPHPSLADMTHIVTTAASTRTTIGEATLILAAESEVHVGGSDDDGWLVRLDRGEVDCEVAPRHGRPPFIVQAGETRVTVIGTRFTVIRDGVAARVRVREGIVQVASGARQLSLAPGEEWPPAAPAAALEPPPPEKLPPARVRSGTSRAPSHAATPARRFEAAARQEADDPEAALAIYRSLGTGTGHWAANALYAEARLELEQGHPERARSALRRYLQRYPRGSNASDVRALLNRIGEP